MTDNRMNPRRTAFEILQNIERSGSYSNLELSARLREAHLDPRDAGFVCALVYGVLERRITLDYILNRYLTKPVEKARHDVRTLLRLGAYQIVFMDRVPDSAAVNESVRLARSCGCSFAAGMVNAVLRKVAGGGADWRSAGWEVRYSCPRQLIDFLVSAYGKERAEGILAASLGGTRTYIRVNTLRTSVRRLQELLMADGVTAEPADGFENALAVAGGGSLENLPEYRDGLFHVQGLPSQICAALLDARPGMRIADICAAPGGKSFTIAQMMDNRGEVFSFDLHPHRVDLIRRGAARLGIGNIRAQVRDAREPFAAGEKFDRVLCDVPCSGLGDIASKPELRYKDAYLSEELPALQAEILERSAAAVALGGKLVYSTCTLSPRENEDVCRAFLARHSEFRLLPAARERVRSDGGMMTFLPQDYGGYGFFAAVMERGE